jgi:hypothetical protein
MTVVAARLPSLASVLVVASLLVAGCSLIPNPLPSGAALAADLRAAQQRWAAKSVDTYQLTMRYYCLCPFQEAVRVSVEDRRVTAVNLLDGRPADPEDVNWYPLLVESAFRTVEENLGADEIEVTFDPDFGFPSHVSANPDTETYDEEVNFDVTDFVPGT